MALLEKNRNRFLQITCENILPNKVLGKKEIKRFNLNNRIKKFLAKNKSINHSFNHIAGNITHNTLYAINHNNSKKEISEIKNKDALLYTQINCIVEKYKNNLSLKQSTSKLSYHESRISKDKKQDFTRQSAEKKDLFFFSLNWDRLTNSLTNNFYFSKLYPLSMVKKKDIKNTLKPNPGESNLKAPVINEKIKDLRRNQLMEFKKLRFLYGDLPKRTFARIMKKEKKNFFIKLESRLDVVLKNILFFPTIYKARQYIVRGKVYVNNHPCTFASYTLKAADFISIKAPWKSDYQRFKVKKKVSLFLPKLMKKWNKWAALWISNKFSKESEKKNLVYLQALNMLKQHTHGKQVMASFTRSGKEKMPYFVKKVIPYYSESCYFYYLNSSINQLTPTLQQQRNNKASHSFLPKTLKDKEKQLDKRFAREKPLKPLQEKKKDCIAFWLKTTSPYSPNKRKNTIARIKLLLASLFCLHKKDGLNELRLNRLFIKGKSKKVEKAGWLMSRVKPINVESNYKQATAIFLFAPQKIVWPCTLNFRLLQQHLN